ncbi:Glyco_tran_28_C domain-containing protein [Vibrio chagasii]|uniref:PssE/Cps14G family polysaccharide biosynthesis glycosyltransferase n=1 Tax=Vibrio chagasii TaxID=170679 RepID=UPI00337D3F9D|nr:Glyco_tran_28_C domain-containing protein [Vibrio chagasii]CAH7101142.1 Glyco_tran_28_C domain-containing protein [Vibrio chagasii]CAH7117661.1 Glyco_tran_28_C domain-containing protein [Vibrio chagasii]CAH7330088.1 Glyco_tran_28_C domain-containing protein [Vibrio chagasii]
MRILVTVGTFKFDGLIKTVDNLALNNFHSFTCQIGSGEYKPKNCNWFDYSSEFDSFVQDADLVITHAGAGTVYGLLEKNKNIIVIPNIYRVDHHQRELSKYVGDNNFALTCEDLNSLEYVIEQSGEFFSNECRPYSKENFSKYGDIINYLKN